jgi:hypothetical protein
MATAPAGATPGAAYGTPSAPFERPAQLYGAANGYGIPGSAAPPWAPRRSRFIRRWQIALAGVLAVGVAAAVTVPTVFGSGSSALSRAFDRSLLTPETVSSLANETFTIDTSKDNSSDDSSSGCMDAADTLTNSGQDKGDASRQFAAADHSAFIAEDLSNNPTNAQQLDLLKNTLKTCHSATIDGGTVTLTTLPAPQIDGSDDTMAMMMSGEISGHPLVFELTVARFGDDVVVIFCFGIDASIPLQTLTNSLLAQAALTARPAFQQGSHPV